MSRKALSGLSHDEFCAAIDRKRAARMSAFDSQTPAVRNLANEYGWTTVDSFLRLGVTNPRHIRHLVETVLNEFSPTRGSHASQGIRRAEGIARDFESGPQ